MSMLDEVEKTGYKIPTPREKALSILVERDPAEEESHLPLGEDRRMENNISPMNTSHCSRMWRGICWSRLGYEKNNNW